MSNETYGIVDGVYYCGINRTQELNSRIAERNIPSSYLQPQFSMRPVSTKYALLPVVDIRAKSSVPIKITSTYNQKVTFNPGTAVAPWSGFVSNVNKESELRNMYFALQNCQQSQYIPSSKSDMYKTTVTGTNVQQPFPNLFEKQSFDDFNPNNCNIGGSLFANCTRQQLKNI